MQLLAGVPTIKRDLSVDAWYKTRHIKRTLGEKKAEVRRAALREQKNTTDKAVKDLTQYIEWMTKEFGLLGSGPIRSPNDPSGIR